jgi:glycosyltransferase involved in cell wall biosynthesis
MRIGLLYPTRDALSPANWSGTPHGLAGGLAACGAEVVPLGAKLPPGIHQAVAVLSRAGGKRGAVADRTLVRQFSRNRVLRRRVSEQSGRLDAIVAMGLEMYDLGFVNPDGVPVASYDDGTLEQMWRNPDSDIRQAGFPEREVRRWFARQRLSARAASVTCVSTGWAARSFIDDFDIEPERVHVVGMGHRPRSAGAPAPRDWSAPRYLFIGVDWQRKNGDAVLRAFRELRQAHPDATIDLVGRHPLITEPGVRDHGYLPREDPRAQRLLDGLLETATAFVLPSRFDPSPIAYLEAASAGLPVIATSEGGAGELLGEAAITVHPDDQRGLLAGLERLSDADTACSMGALAYRNGSSSSWADVASRVLDSLSLRDPGANERVEV